MSAATSPRRTRVLNLLLLVATLAALGGLGEAAVRLAGLGPAPIAELSQLHQYDSLLGWRNRPGAVNRVRTGEFDIVERFDSLGLRGPERPTVKPAGRRRVLLLGDSFVEGYTVSDSDVVSAVLERQLGTAQAAPVEVLNAGTAGYATDQELLYYETRGRTLGAEVVVLFFYVNDVWFNTRDRYWRGHKPWFVPGDTGLVLAGVPVPPPEGEFAFAVPGGRGVARLVRRADALAGRVSALYRWFRGVVMQSDMGTALLTRAGLAAVPDELRPWRTWPDAAADSAWRVTEALLGRLSRSVSRGGARLVVFHVPARPAVDDTDWARTRRRYAFDDSWSPRAEADRLRGICQRRGLDCLFPEAQFRAATREGPLYFRGDAHWNARGHALAARLLAAHLAPGLAPR